MTKINLGFKNRRYEVMVDVKRIVLKPPTSIIPIEIKQIILTATSGNQRIRLADRCIDEPLKKAVIMYFLLNISD